VNTTLKNYFLAIIQSRDYSQGELVDKAQKKGYSGAEIKEVLTYLSEQKILDDQRLAESIVEFYSSKKGYNWIIQKLNQRKIPKHIIENIQESIKNELSLEMVKKLKIKYQFEKVEELDQTNKMKLASYLSRQGYKNVFDLIKAIN
jgi:SOS response regulatory protein OraA/RecX